MSEKAQKLVRMANQIADFFHPYPEEEAVAGIQEHILSFWTRAMREELSRIAEAGGAGLQPRVRLAIERLRGGASPIDEAAAGPETLGQAMSDAG